MSRQASDVTADERLEVRALESSNLAGEAVPTEVLVAPWGMVETTNGPFVVDEESIELARRAFAEHGTDLPIDYEHQTLGGAYASPSGQAPAAGWIKALVGRNGEGLFARIEWTDTAERLLRSKQYRYLSPVAIIRKSDRKLIGLHSAALTNKPAIVGAQPIVNKQMPCSDDADEAAVSPLTALREELGLEPQAKADEVLLAASARLAAMQDRARRHHVDERIREAVRGGKLVEAQRAWAEALVAREEGLFDEWLRTAPVVVMSGKLAPPRGERDGVRCTVPIAARARAEYRASRLLSSLTSEEAYVNDAIRLGERVN